MADRGVTVATAVPRRYGISMILVPFRLLLAAAFVAAPIAAHAETIKAGNWLVDTTTDPKTQQVRVGAVLDAKAGDVPPIVENRVAGVIG